MASTNILLQDANVTAIDCIDETANYGTITTIAILAGNIMSLPLGILLDKKGTFICRIGKDRKITNFEHL
jgi:hypothetical protein